MINKIYYLKSDLENYSSFIQNYPDGEESIIGRAMDQRWSKFTDDYTAISLELIPMILEERIINLILVVFCRHLWFLVKMH